MENRPINPAGPTTVDSPVTNKIQHTKPGIIMPSAPAPGGEPARPAIRPPDEARPLPVAQPGLPAVAAGKITAFGKERRHEDSWARTPNTTGNGAIHVKTFHCKLTDDAIQYMD